MDTQTSTDYSVDNRYQGMSRASDNTSGKRFLSRYLAKPATNLTEEREQDNKFVVSAPGWNTNFEFRNAFGSPRSPSQRRLVKLNQ